MGDLFKIIKTYEFILDSLEKDINYNNIKMGTAQ